jgi:hypothetical protein
VPGLRTKTIAKSSASDFQTLWESGTSLDFAWVEFARFFDHFAWMALQTHPDNDGNLVDHPRYQQLSKGWLPVTWEARQLKLETTTKGERANLLGELYGGRLWAIGCRTLPDGSDELVRIPRQLFFVDDDEEASDRPDIHWSKGELTVGQDSYFDIRVVKPAGIDEGQINVDEGRDDEKPEPGPSKGRPNTRDRIRATAKELLTTDPQFRALPNRDSQARALRVDLFGEEARDQDDMVGHRTSRIARIIGEVANDLARSV